MTPRQRSVIGLAAQGMSNTAIADRLDCTLKAVERALEQTYESMGINGDPQWHPRLRAVICWLGAQT